MVYEVCLEVNVVVYNYVKNCVGFFIFEKLILLIYYMIVVGGIDYIFCVFYVIFGIY